MQQAHFQIAYTLLGIVLGTVVGISLWALTGYFAYLLLALAIGLVIGSALDVSDRSDRSSRGNLHHR